MKILNGTVEMGVIGTRFPGEEHLVGTSWMGDTLKLIVPSTHRWGDKSSIAIEDLRKEPLIVREKGSGTLRTLKKALLAKDLKVDELLHIVAEIGNTEGVIGGIKSGLGVSILSPKAIEDELANASLKALDIKGVDLKRQFYLVHDQRRTLSPLAHAFRRYLLRPGEEEVTKAI
jgi:DNA-binding transcriptional LysR family regulator